MSIEKKQETTPSLSESALLLTENTRHVLAEAAISALNSAAVDPVRAIAQVTDRFSGSSVASDISKSIRSAGMESRPAEFGTTNWFAQQLGSAAGMMAPYLVARSAVRFGVSKTVGDSGLSQAHILYRGANAESLTRAAGAEAAVTGSSGFLYGLAFVPSSEEKSTDISNTAFALDRLKTAAYDGLAFGTIGAMSPLIGHGLSTIAHRVDRLDTRALTKAVRDYERDLPLHNFLPKAQEHIVGALRGPVLTGALSGVPMGLVNAEIGALKNGQLLPDSKDVKENLVSMMFVGSAISKINHTVDASNRKAVETAQAEWHSNRLFPYEIDEIRRLPQRKAPTIDAQYARSISTNPSFINWTWKHQDALNSGNHKSVQNSMPELAKLWPELPMEARKAGVEGMEKIMQSWSYMTPRQRELPSSELVSHAKALADFSFRGHAAKQLDSNPTFLDAYLRVQERFNGRRTATDGESVLANWKDIPEHVKKGGDRELMVIGSQWDKLTPTQKQLPLDQLLKISTIAHDLHLKAPETALMEQTKGFVEWYEKQTAFKSLNYQLTEPNLFNKYKPTSQVDIDLTAIKSVLKNWPELSLELKGADLKAIQPIMRIWHDLTPGQKKLSSGELTDLTKLQSTLRMDKNDFAKFEAMPDFGDWFRKHERAFKSIQHSNAATKALLSTWSDLPPQRKDLTPQQARDIAARWNSMKETHKEKSLNETIDTVAIAKELRLNEEQIKTLANNPSFNNWYNGNIRPQEPLPKHGPVLKELQAIVERWPQFPLETQLLSLGSVRSISDIWPHLTPELRTKSALEMRIIAAVKNLSELSASDAVNIYQIEAIKKRLVDKYRDPSTVADLRPVKQEIQLVLDVWKKLPANERPQFNSWLDHNLGEVNQLSLGKLQSLAGTMRTIARRTQLDNSAATRQLAK